MKKIFFTFFLLVAGLSFAQNNTVSALKAEADSWVSSNSTTIQATALSASIMDNYYEGYGILHGFYKIWQATGDMSYLDLALDDIDGSIDAAVNLEDFYNAGLPYGVSYQGGYYMPKWDALGNVNLPNVWTISPYSYTYSPDTSPSSFSWFSPPLNEFIAAGSGFSYNYVDARDTNRYRHEPLGELIYYRYAADLARIMFHNDDNGSLFNQVSGNGQTYGTRYTKLFNHIEGLFDKWVTNTTDQEKDWFVYRQNTHMSSHLGSLTLSLYAITGLQKYDDFLQEWLYDFGSDPNSDDVPSGAGWLKQMGVDGNNAIVWSSTWNANASTGSTGQEVVHGGPELMVLLQLYEENYCPVAKNGALAVDATFMQQLVNTVKDNMIIDGSSIRYRVTGGGGGITRSWTGSGILSNAEYDTSLTILNWLADNPQSQTGGLKMGYYGRAAYASAVLNVGGSASPVYPNTGVGGSTPPTPGNNAPVLTRNGDFRIDINVGGTYTELGADWTDVEDGSGTIASPTTGSVDVNTADVYVLTYQHTDTDGADSNIVYRNVYVNASGNDCPVISANSGTNGFLTLQLNDTYTELGADWTDVQDGSDTIATPTTGSVNTAVAGEYVLEYEYTDAGNCTETAVLTVTVQDNTGNVLVSSFVWDVDVYEMEVGENSLPTSTFLPANATTQFLYTQSSNENIASIDQNGFLLAHQSGTITLTGTTVDGSGISDTATVIVGGNQILNKEKRGKVMPAMLMDY